MNVVRSTAQDVLTSLLGECVDYGYWNQAQNSRVVRISGENTGCYRNDGNVPQDVQMRTKVLGLTPT